MKITKRDVLFFFLGFLTLFTIETIMDWEGTKRAFQEGGDSFYETGSGK